MFSADIVCSWLMRSALVSLTILLVGSGEILIWRQPLRRVRIIELVLAGCLIAPWLGMIPGYPQLSLVSSHSTVIQKPEVRLSPPEPMIEPTMTEPGMTEPTMPLFTPDRAAAPPVPAAQSAEAPVHAFEFRPWIVGIYLAGLAIASGWWLVGIAGLARLLRTSKPAPSRCRKLLTEISGGRSNRVRLLVSRRLSQPFASAWGRPVIVLPESLCGDEKALGWCLAHEWAHIDGHDFRAWLLAGLARVLFFYQPLLWWLRRQLRLCQDFVADSQAALQAAKVEDYAEFLTAHAASRRLHPALGLSMGSRKSELYRRVIMLLKNESLESRTPRLWTVSVALIASVLVAVVAAVSVVPRAVAEEKSAASVGEKTPSPPKEITVDLGNGVKLDMVLIPAGEFMMGSPKEVIEDELKSHAGDQWDKRHLPGEGPQHKVRITKPFYLGKYLVTQEQWQTVMNSNPSYFKGPKNPVEMVSWDDCQQFLGKLNAKPAAGAGKYQLPTEAQWEYACRAGSKTKYCFGNDASKLGEYAWYDENSGNKTHPVGEKKPNTWGLYDMYGNVWEWCQDWWKDGCYGDLQVDDPTGAATGSSRVVRGGGWFNSARLCRSANRGNNEPWVRTGPLGFRISFVPAEAVVEPHSSSANDESSKPPAAKPADEVPPASDQAGAVESQPTANHERARARFIARLLSGITVELLGVSESPSLDRAWWRPDGPPLAERPYDSLRYGVTHPKGEIVRELAIRLGHLPPEPVGVTWGINPHPNSWSLGDPMRSGTGAKDIRACTVGVPATAKTLTVQIGVAAGPWQTLLECGQRGIVAMMPGARGGAIFGDPVETSDKAVVAYVAYRSSLEGEKRIVAVDNKGQVHTAARQHTPVVADLLQLTAVFSDLSLREIKEFRFQSRPYQSVEFRNIALQLGQKTDVQVVDQPDGATSGSSTSGPGKPSAAKPTDEVPSTSNNSGTKEGDKAELKSAPASGSVAAVPDSVCARLRALFQTHYPKATITDRGVNGIHFEYEVTTFEFPYHGSPGAKHEATTQRGPKKGGILCGVYLEKGEYRGQLALMPRGNQYEPYVIDRMVYKQLLMAPYSAKRDAHLWVGLSYPSDASDDFLKGFRAIMNDYEKDAY